MICVPEKAIRDKAQRMPSPSDYMREVKAAAYVQMSDGMWCFKMQDYLKLKAKFSILSDRQRSDIHKLSQGELPCCGG